MEYNFVRQGLQPIHSIWNAASYDTTSGYPLPVDCRKCRYRCPDSEPSLPKATYTHRSPVSYSGRHPLHTLCHPEFTGILRLQTLRPELQSRPILYTDHNSYHPEYTPHRNNHPY